MRLRNFLAAAAVAVTTAVAGVSAPHAGAVALSSQGSSVVSEVFGLTAPAGTVVSQGDTIHTARGIGMAGYCTLGYIDRHNHTAYTAGHCTFPGEPVFNDARQIIGFTEDSNFISNYFGEADVARIRLIGSVVAGPNSFSGDAYVPVHTVNPGDPICVWGARTREVFCGEVVHRRNSDLLTNAYGTLEGDSGGPAWIPGRGFVAVNSAWEDSRTYGSNDVFASPDGL